MADRDGANSADVTATATVTSPHHAILGIFPDTRTKLDSEFAFGRRTLGLQMGAEEEEGSPVSRSPGLGTLGSSRLIDQPPVRLGDTSECRQWLHSFFETGLMRLWGRNHQCTKVRKSKIAVPTARGDPAHTGDSVPLPASLPGCRAKAGAVLGSPHPRGWSLRSLHYHFNAHIILLFLNQLSTQVSHGLKRVHVAHEQHDGCVQHEDTHVTDQPRH